MINKETFIPINSFDTSRKKEKFLNVSKIDPFHRSNIFTEFEKEKNWNYINLSKVITDNSLKVHSVIKKLQNLRTSRNESEINEKILPQTKSLENFSEQKSKTMPKKKYFLKINFPMKFEKKSRNRANDFYTLNSNTNNKNSPQNSYRNSIDNNKKISETERTTVDKARNLGRNILENVVSIPSFNHTTKIKIRKNFIDKKIPSLEKESPLDRMNEHCVLKFNKNISHIKSSSLASPCGIISSNVKPQANIFATSVKNQIKKIPCLNFKNLFKENFSQFEKVSKEDKNLNGDGCGINQLHFLEQNMKQMKNATAKTNTDEALKINSSIGKNDLSTNTNTINKYNTINPSNRKEENNQTSREYSYEKKTNFFMTNVEKFKRKISNSKYETISYSNKNEQRKKINVGNLFQGIKNADLIRSHKTKKSFPQISAPTNTYQDFASEVYLKQEVVKLLDSNSDAIFFDAIKSKEKKSFSIDQSNIFKKCRNVDLINEKSCVKLRNVLESTYKIDFKKDEVFGFDRSHWKIEPLSDRSSVNKEIREIKNFKLKYMLNNLVKKANCKSNFNYSKDFLLNK